MIDYDSLSKTSFHLLSTPGAPHQQEAKHLLSCTAAAAGQGGVWRVGAMGRSSYSSGVSQDPDSPSYPKEQSPGWGMAGLALSWDNTPDVRTRLRNGNHLMMRWDPLLCIQTNELVETSIESIRINSFVLQPVFKMMAAHGRSSPTIDAVMEQVDELFKRVGVQFTKHKDRVYQESWAIRRLCTYAKAQRLRKGPPKEPLWETLIGVLVLIGYSIGYMMLFCITNFDLSPL